MFWKLKQGKKMKLRKWNYTTGKEPIIKMNYT